MHIRLFKKIKSNATIICGFPGFGLIGTITTEFLLNHLNAEEVGIFHYEEVAPSLAIHKGKLVKPMSIFYDKKNNIIIFHTLVASKGIEWKIADCISEFAKTINAKEIIDIEGIPNQQKTGTDLFYFGNDKLKQEGLKPLKEGVIIGVIAGLLLRSKIVKCIFATTSSKLPDSKASAKVIKVLDSYLNLNVDYKPLIKQAELFEAKLKTLMNKSNDALKTIKNKEMNYVG